MDYSILYLLGFIVLAMGMVFGVAYLRKNGYVKSEDLLFVIKTFDLTLSIIDELNIKNEKQIKTIAQLVIQGLKFAYATENKDLKQTKLLAYDYVITLAKESKIEITDARADIIMQLIELGLSQKVAYPAGKAAIF